MTSNWLDLRTELQTLLYQWECSAGDISELWDLQSRATDLLDADPDLALFTLFQALADESMGYCATHALLSAVVCELIAPQMGLSDAQRQTLFCSALVMNLGMSQIQDHLTHQVAPLSDIQRKLIRDHPQRSADILRQLGEPDLDLHDIVRWHHEMDETRGKPANRVSRNILRNADKFVAKMAARKTRLAMSPVGGMQSMLSNTVLDGNGLGPIMVDVLGFYPPGTYVQLVNGEKAVAIGRGEHANYPPVLSIVSPGGMALDAYQFRDTAEAHFAVRSPINAEKIKVRVNLEQAMLARRDRVH